MNANWMEELKEKVGSELDVKRRAKIEMEELELAKRQQISQGYEQIHNGLINGTLAAFNHTMFGNESRSKIEIEYPNSIVNAGSFYLRCGYLQVCVSRSEDSITASTSYYSKNNGGWLPHGGDDSEFTLESNGKQLVILDKGGKFPVTPEKIQEKLLTAIYKIVKLG